MRNMSMLILSVLFLFLWSCTSKENPVHQWRGPDRTGVYREAGLLREWPDEGPRQVWLKEGIGNGFGSPVIAGERIYVTGEIDSMAVLHCLDTDGNFIWHTILGDEWMTGYPGSRSAPTVTGERIYVGTGQGDLFCVEKETGNILWSKGFEEDFGGIAPLHGHSEAPVVHADMVFWTPGGDTLNVVALDRFTGALIWSNPGFRERSGYNQPKLIQLPGRTLFVTFSAYHLMGFDVETGELLFSHEQESYPPDQRKPGYGDTHANTVLFDNGSIYYQAGDGNCGVRLDLSDDGAEIREVWRNQDFDGYMGGIVLIDGFLYGGTTLKKNLMSLDVVSGQAVDSLKTGSGAVIAADEMLYHYNYRGELRLIGYEKGDMTEISSFRVTAGTGQHFSHPVIHGGSLYLRHGDALMKYEIAGEN